MLVSYDGTDYHGSQLQPNGSSIEEKLNEALSMLTGESTRVLFASRTAVSYTHLRAHET